MFDFTKAPVLKLGYYDYDKKVSKKDYLEKYHSEMNEKKVTNRFDDFKDEIYGKWRPFLPQKGTYVQRLQTFLQKAGFMPNFKVDGIFGYQTLAGVRLFQEYMRTMHSASGVPDGMPGPFTYSLIKQWEDQHLGYCEWVNNRTNPHYEKWLDLLEKGKSHYQKNSHQILDCCANYQKPNDTLKVENWNTSRNAVHLIGIRTNQERGYSISAKNKDIFVLLINGHVFYFWGSTVPNKKYAKNSNGFPFLLEGQHQYRMGWHLLSIPTRIYKALRPKKYGVLVYRSKDENSDGIIDASELKNSIYNQDPVKDINIHWTGFGNASFSGGCQVIAGSSYINHQGTLIDTSKFAAVNSEGLNGKKTKGAYNLLSDLILNYAPTGVSTITYTLVRENMAFLSENTEDTVLLSEDWCIKKIKQLKSKMKTLKNRH